MSVGAESLKRTAKSVAASSEQTEGANVKENAQMEMTDTKNTKAAKKAATAKNDAEKTTAKKTTEGKNMAEKTAAKRTSSAKKTSAKKAFVVNESENTDTINEKPAAAKAADQNAEAAIVKSEAENAGSISGIKCEIPVYLL